MLHGTIGASNDVAERCVFRVDVPRVLTSANSGVPVTGVNAVQPRDPRKR